MYIYKEELALDNQQGLICHKLNQTKPLIKYILVHLCTYF